MTRAKNRNEKRHEINTKEHTQYSTIVSDNLEKSDHTRALLFPFPPSYSFLFLRLFKKSLLIKPFIPKGFKTKKIWPTLLNSILKPPVKQERG